MPTLGGVLTNCSSNLPPRAVKPSLLGLRVRACMGDCVSDTPLSRRAGLVGPSAHARTYTDARVHGRQELLARSARILKLTLNPQPSTLNPQPSTLNPEWQAKAAGSNRRHVQEQEFSGLRPSFAPLFVRAYEWACVLASCCVRAQAIACFCARLRLQACLSACVCCRTNRMRHARESTHSSTNSLGHDSDRR